MVPLAGRHEAQLCPWGPCSLLSLHAAAGPSCSPRVGCSVCLLLPDRTGTETGLTPILFSWWLYFLFSFFVLLLLSFLLLTPPEPQTLLLECGLKPRSFQSWEAPQGLSPQQSWLILPAGDLKQGNLCRATKEAE